MATSSSVRSVGWSRCRRRRPGHSIFGDGLSVGESSRAGFVELVELQGKIPDSEVIHAGEMTYLEDISIDHHEVRRNSLFCAVRGSHSNGEDFARLAVESGATAVMTSTPLDLGVPQIIVPEGAMRREVARASSEIFHHPSSDIRVIGVTGTNGKTTVVHLLSQALSRLGSSCRELGTLWGRLTTPEAPDLNRQLRTFVDQGAQFCAMEVSSIALEMHRVDFVDFEVAIFTNLSQDHMDIHGSMERYFNAKAQLFQPELARKAVVYSEGEYGKRLLRESAIPSREVSLSALQQYSVQREGVSFTLEGVEFEVPLIGLHNLANVLCTIGTLVELDYELTEIAQVLASVEEPQGRIEFINEGQPFDVVIDYAHTPAALEAVLEALKVRLDKGARMITVFGCGGDRDRQKRPEMGRVASILSDVVVVTNDNPRSEDPELIAKEIRDGMAHGVDSRSVLDRRGAIRSAVHFARAGDVVLIAGKGHEKKQVIAGREIPFDDVEVTRAILRDVLGKRD